MISITKAEHVPSFWNRAPGELGNDVLLQILEVSSNFMISKVNLLKEFLITLRQEDISGKFSETSVHYFSQSYLHNISTHKSSQNF